MIARRSLTTRFETGHNMSRALKGVRRRVFEEHGGLFGASLPKKRRCVKGGGYPVRDGVYILLEELAKAAERGEATLTVEELSGGVLAGLRGEEGLRLLAKCVRERMCEDDERGFDGGGRMLFVKLGL